MKCPTCGSTSLRKNGRPNNRQRYRCKDCGRQFMEKFPTSKIDQEISVNQSESTTLAEASGAGIAILLLDVENLKIDVNAEKFLASISEYSLQVKIAFANWKNSSLSKYDAELFDRGYQLIHVPEGKNSADAQMMSMGAAIGRQYSDAKAVFVCSSDWLLTHLCNSLQNQGLTVYRVKRQSNNILSIENRNTLEVRHYSLEITTEIPQLEEFVERIQELLQMENESISQRKSQLSAVADLFQKRCEISWDKQANSRFYSNHNQDNLQQVVSQKLDFEIIENTVTEQTIHVKSISAPWITSRSELEEELVKIMTELIEETYQHLIPSQVINQKITQIFGNDFQKILADLKIYGTLEKFMHNSAKFRVQKNPVTDDYQVSLAHNLQVIMSAQQLEKALVRIVKMLTNNTPNNYISTSNISTEFKKQYGSSINDTIKKLQLNTKFIDFLKSSDYFNIKQFGTVYQVAIADY
ncbi:MAG: NYN domain-containing protein [Microcoleaceae cyanobacterium MO_207.B10]|nr:NYN domain-containing protein [Microcoleaceae cyanobacterium MO_207.B10]